jgi:hypothetical protein
VAAIVGGMGGSWTGATVDAARAINTPKDIKELRFLVLNEAVHMIEAFILRLTLYENTQVYAQTSSNVSHHGGSGAKY